MQDMKAEKEKPQEEPKLDTRKPTRNGSYTIPVQMGLGLLGRKSPARQSRYSP